MLRAGLIGFPSSGKTALFQLLTSAREAPRGCLQRASSLVPMSRWPASSLDVVRASITPQGRLRLDRLCRFGFGEAPPLGIEAPGELRLDHGVWRRDGERPR